MGTKFFSTPLQKVGASNLNLMARADNAPSYAGKSAGMGAQKDLAAAASLNRAKLKPGSKTAASAAPGPKV